MHIIKRVLLVLALLPVLGAAACTPAMPPELVAQLADSTINCGSAGIAVHASGDTNNVVNQWGSDYSNTCAGATVTVTDQPGVANIEFTDSATAPLVCNAFLSLPVAIDGAAIATTVGGVDGIIVDAPLLSKILNGAITTWSHPAIAALNPNLTLPNEAILLDKSVSKAVANSIDSWMKHLDPQNWKGIPSDFTVTDNFDTVNIAPELTTEGGIGLVPFSYLTSAGLQSMAVQVAKGQDPVATNLNSIYAGLTQLTMPVSNPPFLPILDPNKKALPADGATTADAPWQALFPIYEHLCTGGSETDIRSFARYSMRTDAQGFLATFNLSALPLDIRGTLLAVVSRGLPSPSMIAAPSTEPSAPTSTDPVIIPTTEPSVIPSADPSVAPLPSASQ